MLPTVTVGLSVCLSVTIVSPAKRTDRDAVWVVDSGGSKEACRSGARWRNLVNMAELSTCGGDAAFYKITLTVCLSKAVVPCQNKIILKNFRPVGRPS